MTRNRVGVDDRVIGMTFSEFGRRIKSNSSMVQITCAAPVFVLRKNVRPAERHNPEILCNTAANDNNVRLFCMTSADAEVYPTIMAVLWCNTGGRSATIMLKNFHRSFRYVSMLPVKTTGIEDILNNTGEQLIINYPNPFVESNNITFRTKGGHTPYR